MARARRSGNRSDANIWPGFVDAMTALLLVIMFVLSIFMVIQFVLRETITGKDVELHELSAQVAGLAQALGLEQQRGTDLSNQLGRLDSKLSDTEASLQIQTALVASLNQERDVANNQIASFEEQVAGLIARNTALDDTNTGLQVALADAEETVEDQADKIEAARASIAELDAARDLELSQKEAAQLALARARAEIDAEAEQARLAAAKADAMAALVADLEAKVDETSTELAALGDAEEARLLEAAAAEALRAKLLNADAELTAMTLALEEQRQQAEDTLTLLAAAEAAQRKLDNTETENIAEISRQEALLAQANDLLSSERALSAESQRQVALLNQQTAALRQQLNSLQGLLDAYEVADREAQVQLQTLGSDLNTALARVAAEQKARAELEAREVARLEAEAVDLRSFRSEFFGRVREVLGDREGVQIVGDRFVFSSEVLFAPGSADLGAGGKAQIATVAAVIRDIGDEIPAEINWVLRVDGHTDKTGLAPGSAFADNWELSQARALSVVKYLIDVEGIPANRLAATGFGEFQPVDTGNSREALARNRRIELKLTEK